MKKKLLVAALAAEINKASLGVIQLFPAGEFRARDGRPTECPAWIMTAEVAQALIAAADAQQTPYVIDYEHQTLRAAKNGQPAPASGWFKKLEWRDGDGLFAVDVTWTDSAAAMIAANSYRFISPVFSYDKSGSVLQLLHAALTNTPAVDGMDEVMLAAASLLAVTSSTQEDTMDELLERLRWMLNLPITATAEDITAELNKLIDQLASATAGTAAASFNTLSANPFSLIDKLTADAASVAALTAQVANPDPAQWVSVDVMQQSVTEALATANNNTAALAQQQCAELITVALSDGRLLPAQKSWAESLAKSSPDSLKTFLDNAPKIAALTTTQTGGKPPAGLKPKTETDSDDDVVDVALCNMMGVEPGDVAKFLKGESNE
ncbi:phage protease [Pectobacterium brasiliense]|uniref:phage protease n=1 Tax=Pectobacterium brasiliense TaxID=180957 RepID=UPI001968C998|nr:phage protease [Pectobacterium brasiliense]MBN3068159.1 phage protease [Pectobacterium brasiliense]MBN3174834.1 phage protease [Pectobacterium brasiliense]MBN3200793.1 phage protease [Pectobacterium brasiliense]MBN3206016.1 phage protease [Pectobacterium brasiliense]